jgi:hypothetical protein
MASARQGGQRSEDRGQGNFEFRIANCEIEEWVLTIQVGPAYVPAERERLHEELQDGVASYPW